MKTNMIQNVGSANIDLVGREGIEPSTVGLKGHCSTTELPSRYAIDSSRICIAVNRFFQKNNVNWIVS